MCNVAHFTKKKKKEKEIHAYLIRNYNAFLAIYSKLHELTITLYNIIMWEQNFSQTSMFYAVV